MKTVISTPIPSVLPNIAESPDLRALALHWLIEPVPAIKAEGVK
jgi:hypothetical protein